MKEGQINSAILRARRLSGILRTPPQDRGRRRSASSAPRPARALDLPRRRAVNQPHRCSMCPHNSDTRTRPSRWRPTHGGCRKPMRTRTTRCSTTRERSP